MQQSDSTGPENRYGPLPWIAGVLIAALIFGLMFGLSAGYY